MTDVEYLSIQNTLVMLASVIEPMDLDGLIARAEHADAVCAVVDPTLYRAGHSKLADVRRLAEAVRDVQREVRRQVERGSGR